VAERYWIQASDLALEHLPTSGHTNDWLCRSEGRKARHGLVEEEEARKYLFMYY